MNRIHRGERLTITGRLKLNGEDVGEGYSVLLQIFEGNCTHVSSEVTMEQGSDPCVYTYDLDTSPYVGSLRFRFVAVDSSGGKTIANNDITRMIYE